MKEECVTAEQLQHVVAKIDGKLDSVEQKIDDKLRLNQVLLEQILSKLAPG